jgi:ribosome biogenesis GTPase
MDTVAVLEPIRPAPDDARIERLLALARESGAKPVLVLTKSDTLAKSDDPAAVARHLARLAPGVPVIAVSVSRGTGVEALRAYASDGRTLALLGRPGAGKSTLVTALSGTPVMPVQQISGPGRHRTPDHHLVLLPSGGAVIDTPGIGGVDQLDTAEGLAARLTGTVGHRRRRP